MGGSWLMWSIMKYALHLRYESTVISDMVADPECELY